LIEDKLISSFLLNEFIKGKLHSNKFGEINAILLSAQIITINIKKN